VKRFATPPVLELPRFGEARSCDVIVVARDGEKISVSERYTSKRALSDVVELLTNGLSYHGREIDIAKVVVKPNRSTPIRMFSRLQRFFKAGRKS